MSLFRLTFFVFSFVSLLLGGTNLALAQSVIRDAEIESDIKTWTSGVVRAAGMGPDQVNIILLNNSGINAFVAGGPNIFIYTGLIQKTENPGELVGVVSHELGHIAGGHLTRSTEVAQNASFEAILGAILGVGAAIATHDGSAAAAGIQIGQSAAMNNFLAHSRVQESSADQAGYRFLTSAGVDPSGLVSFLNKLSSQELLDVSQQAEYVRTHPMSRDRVEALSNQLSQSPLKGKGYPPEWNEQHARIKAKLLGYLSPEQVLYVYKSSDTGIPASYARAIAAYRQNRVDDALKRVDALIAAEPKNPYFYELKGQMLFEFGRAAASISPYEKAVALLPGSGLIRTALAHALIESGGKSATTLQKAIDNLHRAEQDEPRSTEIKRLLATAYGRMGREDVARVYLAEEAVMQGRKREGKEMAESATKTLTKGSPEFIRARDLINSVGDNSETH